MESSSKVEISGDSTPERRWRLFFVRGMYLDGTAFS